MTQNKSKEEKGIDKIESIIPTPKTVNLESFKHHCTYFFENLDTLLEFYNYKTTKNKLFLC